MLDVKYKSEIRLTFLAVAFAEFIDLSCGINNFLFTCKERVTLRTNIYTHCVVSICRTSSEGIPTATGYINLLVFWMNIRFHNWPNLDVSLQSSRIIRNPPVQLKYPRCVLSLPHFLIGFLMMCV